MDKRLPHRLREVRLKLAAEGTRSDNDAIREELCRTYPSYVRLKQQALRKLIAQELTVPLAPAPTVSSVAKADKVADNAVESIDGSRKKRRINGDAASEDQDEKQSMNDSLRKMYHQGNANSSTAGGEEAPAKVAAPPAEVSGRVRLVRERAAMAAARKAHGLSDPQGTGSFAPEERPQERLEDLGGIDPILADLRQLIVQPLAHPEVFAHLGVQPPTGVLLHGPPGSGKTKLAHAIAGTTGVPFFRIAATEIVSGMSGESEAKIRQLFQAAIAAAPSLLFLDEVDAITPKRDSAGREMERRIVAQLLTCMDELQNTHVVVIGATNRPDALDPALRRAGRFDREIGMGMPDEPARARILEKMVRGMRLSEDLDIALLAKLTPGFVGADLSALTKEAALEAVSRAFSGLDYARSPDGSSSNGERAEPYTSHEMVSLSVEMGDFHIALTKVQPSSRREGFTTIPDVKWEDVGALQEVRADLDDAVCEPIRKAALFKQLGLTVPCGVLLFGPPGCGKTLVAKATANASGANFIAIKGPELLNKYVGESERAVRLVFQRAMTSAPCIIFFDELDALVPRRSAEGNSSTERVVNQMLTEMDGVQQRSQVFVIAATNRPDIVDPAMLRPGRLDRLLYVPLPSEAGRLEILQAHLRRLPLADDVDLKALAKGADGFSGADLASLAREAAMLAIRAASVPSASSSTSGAPKPADNGSADATLPQPQLKVTVELLRQARARVHASVKPEERKEYEELATRLCGWSRKGPGVAKA